MFDISIYFFSVPAIWNEEVIYNMGQIRGLQTVNKNIQQLPPGHLLVATDNGTINVSKYYELTYLTREEEKK
jgi:asparagine synthetase B (glutamine-hydrolysing)